MHTCMRPDPDFFLHFRNNINSLFTSTQNSSRSDPDFFLQFLIIFFFQFFGHIHLPPIFFVASTHSNPDFFMHFHSIFYCWYTSIHLTPPPLLAWDHIHPTPTPTFFCISTITLICTPPPPATPPGFVLQFYNNSNSLFTSIPPTILAYLSRRLKVELIVMETPVVRTPVKSFKRHFT